MSVKYLSHPYRAFLHEYIQRHPEIAVTLCIDGGLFMCGLFYDAPDGLKVAQFFGQSKVSDIAFLFAYAEMGMNTGLW